MALFTFYQTNRTRKTRLTRRRRPLPPAKTLGRLRQGRHKTSDGGQALRMSSRGSPGASQGSELASSGHSRGGGGRAGSGARLWSCSDWRSLGFYSAVPSSKGPFLSSNSLFISQNHNFFSLLVFCCNVCKHRYRTLVLVLRVFDDAEALLT